eukprot:75021_1
MLTVFTKRLSNLYHHQYRFFAAASAFDGFSDRISKLKSSYPNLFNRDSFISDQEQLLSQYKSLNSLLSEYDAARESIDKATGEKVFIELNESTLINDLNTRNKPFYESLSENVNEIQEKLSTGQEYVNRVIELQSQQESALCIEDKNLQMIEIANVGDKIDEWQLSFADPVNDSSDLGLPISDEEVDQWVREQYHHAPDEVREQGGITYEQHKQVEENWMITLDNKLCDVLKERDPNFNEDKFMEFCAATNEMFHPHSIDHYGMSNYAKSLFRAALWQSKDRCNTVEESIEILINLLEDGRDDDSNIIRGVYEQSPNTRFNKFAAFQLKITAFQLKITDPLFAAKLIQEIRMKLEEIAIDRAQKDVLYKLQVPYLQHERKELETELEETMSTNPANTQRSIKVLKEQEDGYNIEIPELENMLDEILPKRLWQNDISQVKQSIISYAKGNGSLNDIDKSINNTLSSNDPSTDTNLLNDQEILDISVKCHNSRTSNLENYNFEAFLNESTLKKDLASKLICRRMANKRLNSLNVDALVVNLVKILIEDGQGKQLRGICDDYLDIMKRFRGEIEGFITSAHELDDDTFIQIKNAIQNANPGKKITLERAVDPGLQSGFIVKAGVQRFDFSLATVVHQGRMAVGSV